MCTTGNIRMYRGVVRAEITHHLRPRDPIAPQNCRRDGLHILNGTVINTNRIFDRVIRIRIQRRSHADNNTRVRGGFIKAEEVVLQHRRAGTVGVLEGRGGREESHAGEGAAVVGDYGVVGGGCRGGFVVGEVFGFDGDDVVGLEEAGVVGGEAGGGVVEGEEDLGDVVLGAVSRSVSLLCDLVGDTTYGYD